MRVFALKFEAIDDPKIVLLGSLSNLLLNLTKKLRNQGLTS